MPNVRSKSRRSWAIYWPETLLQAWREECRRADVPMSAALMDLVRQDLAKKGVIVPAREGGSGDASPSSVVVRESPKSDVRGDASPRTIVAEKGRR